MKYLLILPIFVLSYQIEEAGCLEMDIIILADLSGSVEDHEEFVVEAINTFIDKVDVSEEGIRMGVIGFNDTPFIISGLSGDKEELFRSVNEFPFSGQGLTYMNLGLQMAFNKLMDERQNAQKLLIVISDGYVYEEDETKSIAGQLKMVNVGICGVLIKSNTNNPQFMRDISSRCYVESSYENLAVELAKMDICL